MSTGCAIWPAKPGHSPGQSADCPRRREPRLRHPHRAVPEPPRRPLPHRRHAARGRMPPPRLRAAIISRIKIMAKLNIAERRLPQDGRIRIAVQGNDFDLRVSTVPTLHGEAVVMRILDRASLVARSRRRWASRPRRCSVSATAGSAARHPAGHRPDRQRQDHDALYLPHAPQHAGEEDLHRRGSDRIPARRRQSGPGEAANRPELRRTSCAPSCARIPTSS